MTTLIFSVAKETGWTEEDIMDMPISRVWSYRHAILCSYDIECYYKSDEDDRQEMYELFDAFKDNKF